jgi:hypothetical protein
MRKKISLTVINNWRAKVNYDLCRSSLVLPVEEKKDSLKTGVGVLRTTPLDGDY